MVVAGGGRQAGHARKDISSRPHHPPPVPPLPQAWQQVQARCGAVCRVWGGGGVGCGGSEGGSAPEIDYREGMLRLEEAFAWLRGQAVTAHAWLAAIFSEVARHAAMPAQSGSCLPAWEAAFRQPGISPATTPITPASTTPSLTTSLTQHCRLGPPTYMPHYRSQPPYTCSLYSLPATPVCHATTFSHFSPPPSRPPPPRPPPTHDIIVIILGSMPFCFCF